MAEQLPLEEYNQEGIDALANAGRPIPGQSLTNSPEQRRPFEQPPEFVNFKKALDYIVAELLEEEAYTNIVVGMGQGVPVADVALQIAYVGFREGKWNPDLMMMLIEPLVYVLMALCEKAGIEFRLSSDPEIEEAMEGEDDTVSVLEEKAKNIAETIETKVGESKDIPAGAVPTNIMQQIESTPVPESLMARTEEPVEEPVQQQEEEPKSLLERG
tara:strand:- start:2522 stop:3166 length:645 start_codon:yes stop_codon:yes gene_type:complete